MSLAHIVGNLNLTLSIPGDFKANGITVAKNITFSYTNEQLNLSFIPVEADGTEAAQFRSANRLSYSKGSINLIGKEVNRGINYMANYSAIGKRLRITVNGRGSDHRVHNLVEALSVIASVVTRH